MQKLLRDRHFHHILETRDRHLHRGIIDVPACDGLRDLLPEAAMTIQPPVLAWPVSVDWQPAMLSILLMTRQSLAGHWECRDGAFNVIRNRCWCELPIGLGPITTVATACVLLNFIAILG